jgi:hypothetical protein
LDYYEKPSCKKSPGSVMCRVLFNSDSCFVAKYNEYVDRLNAIRLLQALVAAGANSDAPMANAWISRVALEIGLKGEEFRSALVYAGGQDWLDRDQKEGWTSLTREGEAFARA